MVSHHIYAGGPEGSSGAPRIRVDHFLVEHTKLGLSRSQIKRLIDEGLVTLAGKVVKTSTKMSPGDELTVRQPPPVETVTLAQDIPLTVLFEDSHLIVIDKVAGMVVHPAPGHPDKTLVNALLAHCKDLSGIGGELRPGIVHRIDKGTSGILVASKHDAAHQVLADGFRNKTHKRQYLAIAVSGPKASGGVIDTLYGRHKSNRKKFSSKVKTGKRAVTRYEVLERFGTRASLLRLQLDTGRTHQIRVHCADSGYAILGDPTYSRAPRLLELKAMAEELGRQALHAAHLSFKHPITGEELSFDSPLPEDIQTVLDALRAGS